MGLVFSTPKPIPAKPRLVLPLSAATWAMLAGAELSLGHVRAAERFADIAEQMRERIEAEDAR